MRPLIEDAIHQSVFGRGRFLYFPPLLEIGKDFTQLSKRFLWALLHRYMANVMRLSRGEESEP